MQNNARARLYRIAVVVYKFCGMTAASDNDIHETATAKVRMWQSRADKARREGRKAAADRCDDKVRDWASRVRQMERTKDA
jgi:hypothetical protein